MTFGTRAVSPLEGRRSRTGDLSVLQPERLTIVHGEEPSGTADAVLSLAPGRWLLVHERPAPEGGDSLDRLDEGRGVDVSQGFVRLRVSGRARALLATGISIDLHPDVFVVGDGAATAYRGIFVVLHAVDDHTLDLYTPRSYAPSLWDALEDAALGLA